MQGVCCVVSQVIEFLIQRFKGHNAFAVSDRVWTAPNAVTAMGIFLIPVYVALFATSSYIFFIPIVSGSIVCTDAIDGWLADRLNQHSKVGKCIDPLRDRMYLVAVFLNLFFLSVPGIVVPALIIAGAEGSVVVNGLLRYYYCGKTLDVHWAGKLRMVIHSLCAGVLLMQEYWFKHYYVDALFLIYIMAAMSIVACAAYIIGHVEVNVTASY